MGKQWRYVSHYKKQEHLNMGSNKPDVWQDVEVNGRMISITNGEFTHATLLPHNMGVCELVDVPDAPSAQMTQERVEALREVIGLAEYDLSEGYRRDTELEQAVATLRTILTELGATE